MKNQIRKARKAAGMTQEQLAKAIGITHATLSRYESGAINPPMSQLQAIAVTLGVSLSELAGLEQIDRFMLAHEAGPEVYGKLEKNYRRYHEAQANTVTEETLKLMEHLERSFIEAGLIEEGQDLSEEDTEFLLLTIRQIGMWFEKRNDQPPDAPETAPEGE